MVWQDFISAQKAAELSTRIPVDKYYKKYFVARNMLGEFIEFMAQRIK